METVKAPRSYKKHGKKGANAFKGFSNMYKRKDDNITPEAIANGKTVLTLIFCVDNT